MGVSTQNFDRRFRPGLFPLQGKKSPRADSRSIKLGRSDHRLLHRQTILTVCRCQRLLCIATVIVQKNVTQNISAQSGRKHFFHFFSLFSHSCPPRRGMPKTQAPEPPFEPMFPMGSRPSLDQEGRQTPLSTPFKALPPIIW